MATSLFRWLTRRTTNRFAPAPGARPVRSARLVVEALEDRVVPASHTWAGTGADNLWSNPDNWNGGVPTSGETAGTFVAFAGNTASVMDIADLSVDTLQLTGADNAITLNTPLNFQSFSLNSAIFRSAIRSSGGTHTITGSSLNAVQLDFVTETGSTLVIDSQLSGDQRINKDGRGTLSFRTVQTSHTGQLNIRDGTLEVAAGGSLSSVPVALDRVTVTSGGTVKLLTEGVLAGAGTVVTLGGGGRVAPGRGVSTQILTVGNADLTDMVYEPTVAGANSDRLAVIGTIDLTGATLRVRAIQPATVSSYTLIDKSGSGAITGTFDGLGEGAAVFVGGQAYRISYAGGDGNDVILTRVGQPPVPPASPTAPPVASSLPVSPPAFRGAQVIGRFLALTGAAVPDGVQLIPVPLGSTALFTDLTGDGAGDVVLFLPDMTLVLDGRTGRLMGLDADDNGDGARDLKIFNLDGTATRIDGRTGVAIVF